MRRKRPGSMLLQLLSSLFKKPATTRYPKERTEEDFKEIRGEIGFSPEKCTGCTLCMKDCPSGAITINKTSDGKFEAKVDLARCIYCGQCVDSCVKKALAITHTFELAQLDRDKLKITFRQNP